MIRQHYVRSDVVGLESMKNVTLANRDKVKDKALAELKSVQSGLAPIIVEASKNPHLADKDLRNWWGTIKIGLEANVSAELADEIDIQISQSLPLYQLSTSPEQTFYGMMTGANAERKARWIARCGKKFTKIEKLLNEATKSLQDGSVTELILRRPATQLDNILQKLCLFASSPVARLIGILTGVFVIVSGVLITFFHSSLIAQFLIQCKQPLGFSVTTLFLALAIFDWKNWRTWLPCAIASSFGMYGYIK